MCISVKFSVCVCVCVCVCLAHFVVPLFSAESKAISKATGSSAGRSGRWSQVRKLNMS